MPTFPVHLSSPPIFSEVCVTRSLVLCVCFVDRCLSFVLFLLTMVFFFNLRILITPLVSLNSSYVVVFLCSVSEGEGESLLFVLSILVELLTITV
jgi:hypothetical protein